MIPADMILREDCVRPDGGVSFDGAVPARTLRDIHAMVGMAERGEPKLRLLLLQPAPDLSAMHARDNAAAVFDETSYAELVATRLWDGAGRSWVRWRFASTADRARYLEHARA